MPDKLKGDFIQPMLVKDYNPSAKYKTKTFIAQPKYDGVRALFYKGNFQSRTGLHYEGVPEIQEALTKMHNMGYALDGELYSNELGFDTISGICRRKSNNLSGLRDKVYYQIFDIVHPTMTNFERDQYLANRLLSESRFYKKPESMYIKNKPEEIQRILEVLLENNYEGLILRDPSALYQFKRTSSVLRIKPFDKDIFQVIDVIEENDVDGNPKGRAGALLCGNRETKFFKAGGLDDILKVKLWDNPTYYIGKLVVIKYQKRTVNNSLRSPSFIRFVDNYNVEKETILKV